MIRVKEQMVSKELRSLRFGSDLHLGDGSKADNSVPSMKAFWKAVLMVKDELKRWWFAGDMLDLWQFSERSIERNVGPAMVDSIKEKSVEGNHDPGMGISDCDLLILTWRDYRIGVIHSTLCEYRGWRSRLARWAVRNLWTPVEKAVGRRAGKELASVAGIRDDIRFKEAGRNLIEEHFLDVLVSGHTHLKPWIEKASITREVWTATGTHTKLIRGWVVNLGAMCDGRCEYTEITEKDGQLELKQGRLA